jgi:hypothetical protein
MFAGIGLLEPCNFIYRGVKKNSEVSNMRIVDTTQVLGGGKKLYF